ncbi:MAG: hypothetical protein EOM91_07150 [Sphingobacteriia bacterium]|nr:hypothetical protein [Sphingobacteriia bacterium]
MTLHVVGSNNGHRSGDAAAIAEFTAREAATRRWLAQALEQAKAQEALAMVLFFQANPQFELARPARGFVGLRESLIELLDRYPGPVLVIHGDTHNFQHNQPLRDARTGRTIERFVRVEVPGSPRIGGVWISIDASAETPFRVELVDLLARDPITP